MQKIRATEVDLGISELDSFIGEAWSAHCIDPFTSIELIEGEIVLLGKGGKYRGRITVEALAGLGEEC